MSVTVISGSDRITAANLTCQSISDLRYSLQDAMNIDSSTRAFVNGAEKAEDYLVRDGDEVTFSRPLGQKG